MDVRMPTVPAARRPGPAPAMAPEAERCALVDATRAVLEHQHFDQLTIDQVLSQAGLGTRSFYRHFSSKEALLGALLLDESMRVHTRLMREVQSHDRPIDALNAWIDDILTIVHDHRRSSRTRFMLRWCLAADREGYDEVRIAIMRAMTAPLEDIVTRGLREGDFACVDPALDVPLIFTLVLGTASDLAEWTGTQQRTDIKEGLLRFILPALGISNVGTR